MAGRKILPDVPQLLRLVEQEKSDAEIAEMFGVSRQAVSAKLAPIRKGAPQWQARTWGWDIRSEHKTGWLYAAIASYADTRQGRAPKLSADGRGKLNQFMEMMEELREQWGGDVIVDYDPNLPRGFYIRRRKKGDPDDSLISAPAA